MEWQKGYSATYYAVRVDPYTWRDMERIEITGGSISRTPDGLMHSADIECVEYDATVEQWIRVYLDTAQDGSYAHEALFTGLATSPGVNLNGRMQKHTLECYSVLKPADDIALPRGWFAPAGSNGAALVAELLGVGAAPVEVVGLSPGLTSTIIAEDGETRLSMAQKVIEAVNWRIRLEGDGTIYIEEKPSEPVAIFDPIDFDVIENEIEITQDWYKCPNVLMAIDDDLTATARDDSPNSPLSTVNRGREVWEIETSVDLGENESIAEYAQRRLDTLQQVEQSAEYDRRYVPGVYPGDLIQLHYPEQGLDAVYTVNSQSVELGHSARTTEKVITPAQLIQRRRLGKTVVGIASLITDTNDYVVTENGERATGIYEVTENAGF